MNQEHSSSQSQPSGMGPQADHIGPHDPAPSAAMKPSEVLSRAADLIEPEGAYTHTMLFHSWHPHACSWSMLDAISREAGRWDSQAAFVRAARAQRYLERAVGKGRLTEWETAYGRTQSEVVTALRQASELARSEGS